MNVLKNHPRLLVSLGVVYALYFFRDSLALAAPPLKYPGFLAPDSPGQEESTQAQGPTHQNYEHDVENPDEEAATGSLSRPRSRLRRPSSVLTTDVTACTATVDGFHVSFAPELPLGSPSITVSSPMLSAFLPQLVPPLTRSDSPLRIDPSLSRPSIRSQACLVTTQKPLSRLRRTHRFHGMPPNSFFPDFRKGGPGQGPGCGGASGGSGVCL